MADPAVGLFSTFVLDFENGWGTEKGTPAGFQMAFRPGSGLKANQGRAENDTFRGDYNRNDSFLDKIAASGKLSLYPTVKILPWFMKWQGGTLTTTGASDPYNHSIKTGSTAPLSAVIQHSINLSTTEYWKFSGCRIQSWTIPIQPTGGIALDLAVEGKTGSVGTTNYNASPTDWRTGTPLDHLMLAAADVTVDGSAFGSIASGSITIDNKLFTDDYRAGGAGTRGSLVPGESQDVKVSLRLAIDSSAIRTLVQQDTPLALIVKYIAQASPSHFWQIKVPRLFISNTSPIPEKGPCMVDVEGMAAYDTTLATQIHQIVQNDQAGAVYV